MHVSLSLSLSLPLPPAPCCPPSIRTMAARWCGPRPPPVPPPLRASTGRYAAVLPRSVGAAWAPSRRTTTLCMTSGWSTTMNCPLWMEGVHMGYTPAGGPCPWWPVTLTPLSRWFGGGGDWWTTAMSSRLIRHTRSTTHHRPRGNSGSEYTSLSSPHLTKESREEDEFPLAH